MISTLGLMVVIISVLTHYVKNHKQELKNVVLGSGIIVFVFYSMAMFAKQMYKSTNMDTAVWLNSISVMVSSLLGAGIAGGISYFVVLKQIKYNNEAVEKQIKSSNESLEKQISENKRLTTYTLAKSKKETEKKNNNVALNYIYLLNTEIALHKEIYVKYLYYTTYRKIGETNINSIFKRFNAKMWNNVKVECAKYLSNELMQNLIGYYYWLQSITEIQYTDAETEKIFKMQLITIYKSISIIKKDFDGKLRDVDTFDIDGKKARVNKTTGELVIK